MNRISADGWLMPAAVDYAFEGVAGEPSVRARFRIRDGKPTLVDLHITASPDGKAIENCHLRAIDVGPWAINVFAQHVWEPTPDGGHVFSANEGHFGEAMNAVRNMDREAHLREIARVYLAHPRAGVRQVELVFDLERWTALRRVREAREAGLIPPRGASDDVVARFRDELDAERRASESKKPKPMTRARKRKQFERLEGLGHRFPEDWKRQQLAKLPEDERES